jgi:hypothetical protein
MALSFLSLVRLVLSGTATTFSGCIHPDEEHENDDLKLIVL